MHVLSLADITSNFILDKVIVASLSIDNTCLIWISIVPGRFLTILVTDGITACELVLGDSDNSLIYCNSS